MKYPKRSQYQYAKSPYRNIDPSRDARQLPSGVMLALGTGSCAQFRAVQQRPWQPKRLLK